MRELFVLLTAVVAVPAFTLSSPYCFLWMSLIFFTIPSKSSINPS
jgi:hypothetical protein